MNNKKNKVEVENDCVQFPPVFTYTSANAIFVRCKTSDARRYHIKINFRDIVSIQADKDMCQIHTTNGVFTVLATLTDVSDCLPPDMFARINWHEVLNLSLVDSIDVRILYIGKSTYFVDRMFADTVMQSFHMISQDSACLLEPASYYDSVFIRVTEKFQRVRINEIQWIESYHNYCDIYTTGTSRPYCCLISLATWQKILPQKHFMRLHRSVIVNVNHVDAIQTGKVYYRDIPSRFQGHKGVKSPRFSISYKGGKVANDFQSGRKAEKSDIQVPILSELMEKHALQPENFLTHKILRTFALARTSEGRCKDTRRQSSDHPTSKCPSTQAYKREY